MPAGMGTVEVLVDLVDLEDLEDWDWDMDTHFSDLVADTHFMGDLGGWDLVGRLLASGNEAPDQQTTHYSPGRPATESKNHIFCINSAGDSNRKLTI